MTATAMLATLMPSIAGISAVTLYVIAGKRVRPRPDLPNRVHPEGMPAELLLLRRAPQGGP